MRKIALPAFTLDQCINDTFHQEFGIRNFDFVPFEFSDVSSTLFM